MIKILGTLKGVTSKSKVDNNNSIVHFIDLKLEITQGADKVQDIVAQLKNIVEVAIDCKQPKLAIPYKENDKEDDE